VRSALIICCCLASGCGSSTPGAPPNAIVIGELLPFTGAQAASGTNVERAITMVVDAVNGAGGIGGRPLFLVPRDTHSNPDRGFAAALDLIDNHHALAILGPSEGDLAQRLAITAADRNIPFISGGTELPEGLSMPSAGYFFRTVPSALALANVLSQKMVSDGVSHPLILAINDGYGTTFSTVMADQLQKLGNVTAEVALFGTGSQSLNDVVRSSTSKNPDAVVIITYPDSGASLVQAWTATSATSVRYYLAPSLKTDVFLQNVPPSSLISMSGVSPAVASDAPAFAASFTKRWAGDFPLPEAYFYYDATALCVLAIAEAVHAGDLTGTTIRDHIPTVSASGSPVAWFELPNGLGLISGGANIDYRGTSGSVDLNPTKGEPDQGLVQLWQVENGAIVDGDLQFATPQ